MKMRLFLTILLAFVCCTARAAFFPNSFTTNALGTNLVFNPLSGTLTINSIGPALVLYNTAGGANQKQFYLESVANSLQFNWSSDDNLSGRTLGYFDTNGNFIVRGYLGLNDGTNQYTDNGTNLLRNGVPIATAGPTVTNTVVNNVTNNSTVVNSTTINSTTVNSTTNIFNVAKGGHLEISSNLTVLAIGPSKIVRTDANTNLAAVTIGTGLAFDGTTLSSTGSGGSSGSTNYRSAVIALTMTGTNVDASQIDWLKTNQCYRLTLTGNAFFGDAVCINVPDTNSFQWLQLNLIQDATGNRTVTFTNSIFAGVNGTFAITATANAWDSLTLISSPQTNGNIAVLPSNFLHR